MSNKKENLMGQTFTRLTVIAEAPHIGIKKKRSAWLCQCSCGTQKIFAAEYLKNGDTKSCGCLNREQSIINGRNMGKSGTLYTPKEGTARTIWRRRYKDGDLTFENFINYLN
jgi:hypothetical protein